MDPSVSVHLALLLNADRLVDKWILCAEGRNGSLSSQELPKVDQAWQGFSEPLYGKPSEMELHSLHGCLMAMLLLFKVWQLTVSDPF